MVEVVANSLEDYHIDGPSFKPTKTDAYVTNRRICTFHSHGSDRYSAIDGTTHTKMLIVGDDWLD